MIFKVKLKQLLIFNPSLKIGPTIQDGIIFIDDLWDVSNVGLISTHNLTSKRSKNELFSIEARFQDYNAVVGSQGSQYLEDT